MSRSPTITGNALLGLLAIRSWTAYELTRQMRRALRWAWPRSEANLYSEMKRLVPAGLAEAVDEDARGRSRTRYSITTDGRAVVADWLGAHPPSDPQVQFEALLRVFLADQGTVDELRQTLADTRGQILDAIEEAIPVLEEYDSGQGPFPDRAHLNVLFMHFFAGFFQLVLTWCDDADTEIATWPGTTVGVGLTPGTRRMLAEALSRHRDAVAEHRSSGGLP